MTTHASSDGTLGILIDVTRCNGCETCVAACIESNERDPRQADKDRVTERDGLSAQRYSSIIDLGGDHFARKTCVHCLEPSCAAACLVGALHSTPDGSVIYEADKCIGCRYCMLACPFYIPRYDWVDTAPLVHKCQLCGHRTSQGLEPACVASCPHDVLIYGPRDELLAEARRRLQDKPDLYIDRIYGETDFGGTNIMYISDVDLAALNWPEGDAPSIPGMTKSLVESTPFIGLGVGSTLLGLNWVIRRRQKLMAGQTEAPAGDAETEPKEASDD